MDFGIGIATSSDSWKLAQRAEELGFTHAWFYDTQMITADCFVAMGAAAMKTSRIRLGTGVLVPSNRIAAVTANAFATLNGLASGRIDFGVGTGFSARRAMGLGAMKLADMAEYIRVVYGLLDGETLETTIEGKRKKIRFLNPDANLINTHDPIRLHVSAYGPKSQALTAQLNAAWMSFISDVPGGIAALHSMRQSWTEAGHDASGLYATAWSCGCVLEPGEAVDSPRAMAQAGPRAAVLLHRAADLDMEGWQNTSEVPESVAPNVRGYIEMARNFQPPDARYLTNHRGHFVFVKPEERKFVDAELIRRTTFTATEQELKQRFEALRDAGWSQFVIPITPGEEAAIEDWARIRRAFA
ncbi:MAG TPA: LLM class flavin-dependent oxidoreductase [Acetobacteraceae bacterium]|nr:LLM class flavin-dependent oxidoreductase [Acetobacteraceae bacterium]